MTAFQRSSDSGAVVSIESRPERPAMLPVGLATGELDCQAGEVALEAKSKAGSKACAKR
jgi:hypothetical protein